MQSRLLQLHQKFETLIVAVLLLLMMAVVLVSTLEFALLLFDAVRRRLSQPGSVEFMRSDLHAVFAGFLVILLGIELMETIKMYLVEHVIHVEVVLLVAMIAVGRHVVELDYEHVEVMVPFGIAATIAALSVGYCLVKKKENK